MSINPAKFQERLKSVSATCQKVFDAVPDEELWHTSRIHAELQHQGVSRNLSNTKWCLSTLVAAGLVIEPQRGTYTRTTVRAKPAKQEQPAPSAPLAQITPQQPEPQPQKEITMTEAASRKRSTITQKERVLLIDLLRAKYTESNLSDQEFADSIKGQFTSELKRSHVMNQRETLDIPNNRQRLSKGDEMTDTDTDALLAMIEALEARVAALESPKLL
jgi:hypothetical protein